VVHFPIPRVSVHPSQSEVGWRSRQRTDGSCGARSRRPTLSASSLGRSATAVSADICGCPRLLPRIAAMSSSGVSVTLTGDSALWANFNTATLTRPSPVSTPMSFESRSPPVGSVSSTSTGSRARPSLLGVGRSRLSNRFPGRRAGQLRSPRRPFRARPGHLGPRNTRAPGARSRSRHARRVRPRCRAR